VLEQRSRRMQQSIHGFTAMFFIQGQLHQFLAILQKLPWEAVE
jgi:hypothetical protein